MTSSVAGSVPFAGSAVAELIDPLLRSWDADRRVARPILVATDGGRAAAAALRVAAVRARRDHIDVEAVVVEGTLPSVPGVCITAEALRRESFPASTRLGRVCAQLSTILGGNSWKLRVEFGRFGPTVARAARGSRASLILMGLSREGLARRLLGSGAVARVLQSAQIPVLAVPATARVLPHAAVAAIDFSPASLHAAREVRDHLARPGTLHIVHVLRPATVQVGADIGGWDAIYAAGASTKLAELARDLTTDGITVAPRIESGTVIDSLFRVATEVDAEVIACGARHRDAIERHLVGDVPLQLMLSGEYSVLIAPEPSSADTLEESV
ncbi:MAG TPA: universal stress protein [Gemmatimonadaceae bacterium]